MFLKLTLLFGTLFLGAKAQDFDNGFETAGLVGVGYHITEDKTGLPYLSMEGGAPITIHGTEIAKAIANNFILFEPQWLSGVQLFGPELSENDQFNAGNFHSSTVAGRLAYLTPAVTELLHADWSQFNDQTFPNSMTSDLSFTIDVWNAEDRWTVICGTPSNCKLRYHRLWTPYLYSVSPANVVRDDWMQFHVDPHNVHQTTGTPADQWPWRELRLGESLVDWEPTTAQTDRLTSNQIGHITAVVTDMTPNNNLEPHLMFYNGYQHDMPSLQTCNFAGDDCWKVRVHPKIDATSANSGFTTGGQTLQISGVGFNGTMVSVLVDGVACEVQTATANDITCVTGSADAASNLGSQPGQPGLTRKVVLGTTNFANLDGADYHTLNATTSFETLYFNFHDSYSERLSGWFTAPVDGEYRFYVSCDDVCELALDSTTPYTDGSTTPAPEVIAWRKWYTGWRNYFYENTDQDLHKSEWIALTGGQSYYIKGDHSDGSGDEHFTVSVEIKPTTMDAAALSEHPKVSRTIQQLALDQQNTFEEWSFTINSPDKGEYKINFLNPLTNPFKLWTSGIIYAGCSAYDFKKAIKGYYSDVWSSEIDVTLAMYDASSVETSVASNAVTYTYTITMRKCINGFSTNAVMATTVTSKSTFAAVPPMQGIKSSLPVNGTFRVQCTDADGFAWTTDDMVFNAGIWWIKYQMMTHMPFLMDRIEVVYDYRYSYWQNGVSFRVMFTGVNYDVPLCSILDGIGNYPITGNNLIANHTVVQNFGQSLMFEPIPLEFLRTDAQTPQILVTVDGTQAICSGLNCDYTLAVPVEEATTQVYTAGSETLTISGSSLLASGEVSVKFGPVVCTIDSQTDTQIDCTLAEDAIGGEWTAIVNTVNGETLNSIASPQVITPQVDSVSPNTNINYLGGDILTITGNRFGWDASVVSVTLSDGSACTLISVTTTQIECMVERMFDNSVNPSVTVSVNGIEGSALSLSLVSSVKDTISLVPSSVSPVLKSEIDIVLGATFTDDLSADLFTVVAYSESDPDFALKLYVMSVDVTNNSIKVKFPGALTGTYHLQVSTTNYGRFQSDLLQLDVHGTVTDIQPRSGSKYGGTLVTITGENFSNDPLDNPIKIGDSYCYVLTTSATEITCRQDFIEREVEEVLVIVFLKTSEEAQCAEELCKFSYIEPTAVFDTIVGSFNAETLTHQAVVSGTGLTSDLELWIDGIQQELIEVSDLSAVFKIVDLDGVSSSNIRVYNSAGYPEGSEFEHTIKLTPSILSISPQVGNSGGTWITVTGTGFGTQTQNINLIDASARVSLCQEVEIIEYGVFMCLTEPFDIPVGTKLGLSVNYAKQASYVATGVTYSQSAATTLSAVTSSGSSVIEFVGTGFPTSGFTAKAYFNGVEADSVSIVSSESAIASWTSTGIPAVTGTPQLEFVADDYSFFALPANGLSLTQTLELVGSSESMSCSFAGGCTYAIEAPGLYATLLDPSNSVSFCGNPCALREDLSDSTHAVCELAPLATTFSVDAFQITERQVLKETIFPAGTEVLHDDNHQMDYKQTAAVCEFGMNFKKGHVAVLDEAKVFINFMTDKTAYVNNLVFEGSNDGWATYDVLHTFSDEIHEGWNYIVFRDWESQPTYASFRFHGLAAGACRVTEFKLTGVQAIADTNSAHTCSPSILIDGQVLDLSVYNFGDVTYDAASTPTITSISPRFGSVLGGTTVTLTGTNLQGTSTASVLFDNRECVVQSDSATQIVCLTSDKPYLPDSPEVRIKIDGLGSVATRGLIFRYVSLWSDPETWGGDIPPIAGDSIHVPRGQHLLVDVDSTEILQAIIVEGSLIFAPNETDSSHHRTFDAHYIMIQHGYLEVGTEDFPYTSRITITMYGDKFTPTLPLFGNKVIAVNHGIIDMHGVERQVAWTRLAQTVEAGGTSITLLVEPDWKVGEEIVIASTSFSNHEAETRIISGVSGATITFDEPLHYRHISEVPIYGGIEMPMQGEVGLLTRNILYRGDPVLSPVEKYGAHIMLHSEGDDTSIARIEWIEIKDGGQAFKLGKYPIHMHMIGNVHKSYVKGNAVHQTYNRAFTTHGVHYFRVINNIAFDTMGHTFFIEDAIETNNVYDGNLAIQVKKSDSLLNTDQTPGGFWITNPDNILRNNAIAGTDAYAYWYDMQQTAIGPSYDPNICPEYTKLGEFRDNTAHSTKKYGLRIFHALIPRTFPCKGSPYDAAYLEKGKDDPYWQNPKVPAIFENLVAWKCGRNGAITERTGHVEFRNFRVADNGIAGIEYSMIEDIAEDGRAKVTGGLCVGNTGLNDEEDRLANSELWGVIGPRWEHFSIEGVTFFNYNQELSGAIGTCSHCFHPASTDSGGRTVKTTGLIFDDASVPRRIHWQFPYREIINDLDGSLTGLGPNSWATPYYLHNLQPECLNSTDVHEGIICDNTVQIRRVCWYDALPGSFTGLKLKVAQWDDHIASAIKADATAKRNFEQDVDHSHFSIVTFRPKKNPMKSWPVPFVTGHKYRIHWAEGIDFEDIRLEMSPAWQKDDLPLHIMTNHTDVRVAINVTTTAGELIENNTYNQHYTTWLSGFNVLYNETAIREFNFLLNGKDLSRNNLRFQGFRCIINCVVNNQLVETGIEATPRYWSNPKSWPTGVLPVEDEEVEIKPTWNMIMDIEPPLLKKLTINGRLSFLNDPNKPHNLTLHARIIYVRAGEFLIGSEDQPYNGNAEVRVYGAPNDETLAFSMMVEGGNKVMAVVGKVAWFGEKRDQMSRLRQTALAGASEIRVYANLDWRAGDKLALLPTASQYLHTDFVEIQSYDASTGIVTLTEKLKFYHWGQSGSTAADFSGVDMRGEVIMLSRNVRFVGDDTDGWGGQIVVTDNYEYDWQKQREGNIVLDSVEVYNCSQRNTFRSGIRFEQATRRSQLIRDSSIWGSLAWGLSSQFSANILVENTHIIGAKAVGVNVFTSNNVTFDRIIVGSVTKRDFGGTQAMVDREACVTLCAYNEEDDCTDIKIRNSIAAGCPYAGFIQVGHDCGTADTQDNFRGNVAHSSERVGAHIIPDKMRDHATCYEGSHFAAYKVREQGVAIHYLSKDIRVTDMVFIDNKHGGVNIQTAGETEKQIATLRNTIVYGEAGSNDCPDKHPCICENKEAFMSFGGNHQPKPFHIVKPSALPCYKVKSYGAWAIEAQIYNVTFQNYAAFTSCGARQSVFTLNPYGSDYIPPHNFEDVKFINVTDDAIALFADPDPKWFNPDDCIGFPCTAPSNVMLDFKNTKFSGEKTPNFNLAKFKIVSDTADVSDKMDNCQFREMWNAWVCNNDNIGVLKFIGDDPDWEDRNVSPVYIMDEESGFNNKVNIMMDHMWDGFYTGQKHKSQMNTLLQVGRNYTIEYTSTPFLNMRYKLMGGSGFSKIRIYYWNAGSYHVYVNNKLIDYTEWDKNLGTAKELSGYKGCGENRYVGVKNFLEFIITPGCEVTIKPRDAIMCNVRMEWTMNEFYDAGGVTAFQDRVAAALGIHASRIKTVAVYKGSVVVDYAIQAEASDTDSTTTLRRLQRTHDQLVLANSQEVFGAPILSASTDGEVVVADVNYKPQQNTNINSAITQHATQEKIQTETQVQVEPIENEKIVTVEDDTTKSAVIIATSSLIWLLVAAAVIFVCCVGCGGIAICILKRKTARDKERKLAKTVYEIKKPENEASESELEQIRRQFALNKNAFDIDIVANKKYRQSKFNQDEMQQQDKPVVRAPSIDDSAMKPITMHTDYHEGIVQTESNAVVAGGEINLE